MDDLQVLANALVLNRVQGLGPVRQQALLQRFSLNNIFQQEASAFDELSDGIRAALVERLDKNHIDFSIARKELEYCQAHDISLVSLENPLYPPLLKETVAAPVLLYVKGDVNVLSQSQLAVVGARKSSQYARRLAFEWSKQLQQNNIAITSGLAEGIDAAAHQGALAGEGKTVAVVAHGLDSLYPKRHARLADQIVENGAVISEFAIGMAAQREFFPRRNRIISGLSEATLVVEAAIKSGTLITARCAIEQNRDVFAVPGMPGNPMVDGCHHLIKEGAYLADSVAAICENMGWQVKCAEKEHQPELTGLIEKIPFEFSHLDELVALTGMNSQQLAIELMPLEAQGLIEKQMGSFRRIA